jgi:hypothetical protein
MGPKTRPLPRPLTPRRRRAAHERNDETLERIYIGRRFKNDTERLETLFDLYMQMTAKQNQSNSTGAAKATKRKAKEASA